jgi:succinyl-CoA synthetase beta subunit
MTESANEQKKVLKFDVFSGGTVSIDLTRCVACETKGCITVCRDQGGPLQLDAANGTPELRFSPAEIQRGGCVECLGCEIECSLSGLQALSISLPIIGLAEYLDTLTQPTAYQR